ncbi:dihydrofolate reductase family protein [Aeromicrobium choanae]|uniref:Dihydrofolate reductase n=1 Tax=Aeromicrobium choanae TaxID=1736691 RepID=A0A1T4Z7Z7_9ACTN|nr:dihydrofolate reductase family protein [Aeromicrobium choanae]SKB10066.1 Dihydrofolate reductase [Aeromicrobium choanae]
MGGRRVVLYTLTSIDGAVDEPGAYFPDDHVDHHGAPAFDPVLMEMETALTDRQDAVLLGRNTYDEWSGYWPSSQEQPFADFINGVRKYVVTSTPLAREWGEVTTFTGALPGIIAELVARPGRDIGVHGSIQLAQSLLATGLVDELNLVVGPTLDPTGRRLFADVQALRRLRLTSASPTPNGSVWLTYDLRS